MVAWSQARPWMAWPPLRPLAPQPSSRASSSVTDEAALRPVPARPTARQAAADHGHVTAVRALQRRVEMPRAAVAA
jgi:hypothetical protein